MLFPRTKLAVVDRLRQHWSKQRHLHLNAGAPEDAVRLFEVKSQISLPKDFAQYLLAIDGFQLERSNDLESCDDEAFVFYPLSKLAPSEGTPGHYVFCENWMTLRLYAICLDFDSMFGQVTIVGSEGLHACAPNFSNFVDMYLAGAEALYLAGPLIVPLSECKSNNGAASV